MISEDLGRPAVFFINMSQNWNTLIMFVKIGLGLRLICMFWQGLLGVSPYFPLEH